MVFRAVLQAIDMPSDATFEVALNFLGWREGQFWVLGEILEELGDGLGGEGVGAKTIGQDAAEGAPPMPAVNMAGSVQNGLVKEKLPIYLRQCRRP